MIKHDTIQRFYKEAADIGIPRKPYTPPYAKIIHTP
jgi:hypothetical protein